MNKVDTVKFMLKLQFAYSDYVKEIKNHNINIFDDTINNNTKKFLLNDVISDLLKQSDLTNILDNKAISFYDNELKSFIYCGIIPLNSQILIPYEDEKEKVLIIKIRHLNKNYSLLKMELLEENQDDLDEENQNLNINEKSKRSKERKIGYIIEKVFLWRKLYNGFYDDNNNFIKLTLEEAADKVGISKKSLDDYLIQLRIGKLNGFNFNEHKNDKVGVLRAFVKKSKSINEIKGNNST